MNSYLGIKGYTIYKEELSQTQLYHIRNELNVKPYSTHLTNVVPYPIYRESSKKIYLPRYYGCEKFGPPKYNKLTEGDNICVEFKGNLYDYQINIINKYITHVSSSGGGLLDVEPGKGKTVMALNIISRIKKKTLVVVHKSFLMNQWEERINQFLPGAKVGKIQGEIIDIEDKDIVLGMLQSLSVKEYDVSIWKQFGLCVFDECHHLSAEVFCNIMIKNVCNCNLGLSGTMTRKDGLSKIFKWFIGPVVHKEKSDLSRNVRIKCIEYENESLFENIPVDFRGNIMYSTLISKICNSQDRTNVIINIIKNELKCNYDQQIIVLAHNKTLIEQLYNGILEFEKSLGFYLGGMKENALKESESKKVIIGTYAMASEGLDIKTLTTLVMATPKTDVCQSVGRILRCKHNEPLVIDIVDTQPIFINQFNKRKKYYIRKKYNIDYYSDMNAYFLGNKNLETKKCLL